MRRVLLCRSIALAVLPLSTAEATVDAKHMHHADSPAEAQGRRILSTAFVRVGPDGYLTVELHDGRALVLRNVKMGAANYCGERTAPGKPFCGRYGEVAAARPGGGPTPRDPADLDPLVR